MTVAYRIQVVHSERGDWLGALRQAVATELQEIGMHRSVVVDVTETLSPASTSPVVSVVLVGPGSRTDPIMIDRVSSVLSDRHVVIPVVEDLGSFRVDVPDSLSPLNGFEWSGDDPGRRLSRVLLEELGIEDRERRVFISHRRSDGLGAAEQLHDTLSHFRFETFIDRFAIRPGEPVQSRIADALEHYAFMLVLETPDAHLSDWVYDEVDYALSHTMGTLILRWPEDPTAVPGSPGVPRLALDSSDLIRDAHGFEILSDAALDRVIERVEAAHANGLVRRRRMLVSNVEEAATEAGGQSLRLKDWIIDVTTPAGRAVVAVAPRIPTAPDLQRLDEARSRMDPNADAVLVHAARRIGEDHREHLAWVKGTRNIALVAENAIGAHW
jgi:hypothetical protein